MWWFVVQHPWHSPPRKNSDQSRPKTKAFCKFFTSIFVHENEAVLAVLKKELTRSMSHDEIDMAREEVYNLLCRINPSMEVMWSRWSSRTALERWCWVASRTPCWLCPWPLPHKWASANVSPVHKKGSKHSVSNWRPVSLTCIAVNSSNELCTTTSTTTTSGKLNRFQHSFRKNHSCQTQLLETVHHWAKAIDLANCLMLLSWTSQKFLILFHTNAYCSQSTT